MTQGANLPDFRAAQLSFAAHIRHPERNPRPADIEPRRMAVYVGLIYRNIESFMSSAFPVLKSCLDSDTWDVLIREFIHTHPSASPYFLEISQEFLAFLDTRGLQGLPGFALELAHYEWVELALDVAMAHAPAEAFAAEAPLPEYVSLSALAQPLGYHYAVHQIGADHQPAAPADNGCFLIAYRDQQEQVKFIESNPLTHRLLELIEQESVAAAGTTLHQELVAAGGQVDAVDFDAQLAQIVRQLLAKGVLQVGPRLED
ncbi:MAG: putative DNA-binding domain-containing protein [Pseudomonadales bacterium]